MRALIVFIMGWSCVQQVLAQQQPSLLKRMFTRAPYDTNYVTSYYDHFLHVTLVSNLQDQELSIRNSEDDITVGYQPNNAFRFGVAI